MILEGYTELGEVGFTDRGVYNSTVTYYKNDLVNKNNTVWKCLKDDVIGTEPGSDATTWTAFIRGPLDVSGAPITSTEYYDDLYENTWKQISDASRLGIAQDLWNIGDFVPLKIVDGIYKTYVLCARIAAFNHDDLSDGTGKAGITFITDAVLSVSVMFGTTESEDGYTNSNVDSELKSKVLGNFPEELKSLVRNVKKKVVKYVDSEEVVKEFDCKIYLPSVWEIWGSYTGTATWRTNLVPMRAMEEGNVFELYNTAGANINDKLGMRPKAKYYLSGPYYATAGSGIYWLRTPSKSTKNNLTRLSTSAYTTATNSLVAAYSYSQSAYVAFCFSV